MQLNAKLGLALDSMAKVSDLVSESIGDVRNTFKEVHLNESADNIFEMVDGICIEKIKLFSNGLNEIGLDGEMKEVYLKVFKDKVNEAGNYLVSKVGSELTLSKDDEHLYISKAMGGNLCLSYAMSIGDHGLTSSEKERLLKSAADGGHPEACNEISIWYEVGRNLTKNEDLARHYSNRAYDLFNEQTDLYNRAKEIIGGIGPENQEDISKIILSWVESSKTRDNEIIMGRISTNIFLEVLSSANHDGRGYEVILAEALLLQDSSNSVHYNSSIHKTLIELNNIIARRINMYFRGLESSPEYLEGSSKLGLLKEILGRV